MEKNIKIIIGLLILVALVAVFASGSKIADIDAPGNNILQEEQEWPEVGETEEIVGDNTDDTGAEAEEDYGYESISPEEIDILPGDLSQDEIGGLMFVREEEKLARDVYLTLAGTWNVPVFDNIARAESMHMDEMKILLAKLGIDDPVKDDTVGVFESQDLKALYEELITMGKKTLTDAYLVGALIEDMDIADLNNLISETKNPEIISVYEKLKMGSENHMRAFMRQLEKTGETYTPEYISVEEFDAILSTGMSGGIR